MIFLILVYVSLSISIILIIKSLSDPLIQRRMLYARLPKEAPKKAKAEQIRFIFSPLFAISNFILTQLRLEEGLKKKITAAHIKLEPKEFFTIKLIFMAGLFMLAYFVFKTIDTPKGLICFFLGYVLPDIWLREKVRRRKKEIARILPETVDLIGLCIEAGLDFTMAVKWVVDMARPNPLLEELAFVLEEIKWGKPRTQALRDMSKRLNISEVTSFVQFIIQAERMGTPISEAFSILSEDSRTQRFERGERLALQAPLKILLPLLFFILPVIGIIVMGPVFLRFLGQKDLINF